MWSLLSERLIINHKFYNAVNMWRPDVRIEETLLHVHPFLQNWERFQYWSCRLLFNTCNSNLHCYSVILCISESHCILLVVFKRIWQSSNNSFIGWNIIILPLECMGSNVTLIFQTDFARWFKADIHEIINSKLCIPECSIPVRSYVQSKQSLKLSLSCINSEIFLWSFCSYHSPGIIFKVRKTQFIHEKVLKYKISEMNISNFRQNRLFLLICEKKTTKKSFKTILVSY